MELTAWHRGEAGAGEKMEQSSDGSKETMGTIDAVKQWHTQSDRRKRSSKGNSRAREEVLKQSKRSNSKPQERDVAGGHLSEIDHMSQIWPCVATHAC